MTLYVMDGSVHPCGVFSCESVTVDQARELLSNGFKSAVRRQEIADLMSRVLGVPITVNSARVDLNKGDSALVFSPLMDVPRDRVLTDQEVSEFPYQLWLIWKLDDVVDITEEGKQLAVEHAEWTSGFFRWVYEQAFIHGFKHGYEYGRNKLDSEGVTCKKPDWINTIPSALSSVDSSEGNTWICNKVYWPNTTECLSLECR